MYAKSEKTGYTPADFAAAQTAMMTARMDDDPADLGLMKAAE
jgi:hypothetical protein